MNAIALIHTPLYARKKISVQRLPGFSASHRGDSSGVLAGLVSPTARETRNTR
jgi:hypothetical protein